MKVSKGAKIRNRYKIDEVTRTTTNPILVNLGFVVQPGFGLGELKSFP